MDGSAPRGQNRTMADNGDPSGRTSFSFVDAHGVEIFAYRWLPGAVTNDTDVIAGPLDDASPQAVVQIAHGIGEHALRYDAFARTLAANGFAVFAHDHRGHGETWRHQHRADPRKLGKPGAGGLRATEAAILQLTSIIREQYPALPVVLFAHSFGSLMAQRLLNEHPRAWDALVLSGSAFRTLRHMESGKLNARWAADPAATGFEWLSRDPAVARDFAADPLCFDADTAKLLGLADSVRLLGTPGPGLAADVPILILSGTDDPLNRDEGLRKLAKAYRARGVRDVALRMYPGARHELLNETISDEVTADIVTWLTDRVVSG